MCNISQRSMKHRQTASLAHWLTLLKHTYKTEMAFKWHSVSLRNRSQLICSHFILHVSVLWLFCRQWGYRFEEREKNRAENHDHSIFIISSLGSFILFPFMFCVCLFLRLASTTLTVSYSVRSTVILYSQTHTHSQTHKHTHTCMNFISSKAQQQQLAGFHLGWNQKVWDNSVTNKEKGGPLMAQTEKIFHVFCVWGIGEMCDSMEPARSPAVPLCLEAGPPLANVMEKGRHFRATSPLS